MSKAAVTRTQPSEYSMLGSRPLSAWSPSSLPGPPCLHTVGSGDIHTELQLGKRGVLDVGVGLALALPQCLCTDSRAEHSEARGRPSPDSASLTQTS